ncbi:hypothetical protein BDQ94DRAFT_133741 [Aspergillus welwitschiae]|uniref:Uncharacterized protein n=1 Tax=Aspergillus welwitschiae TaxID=1341132 RepID=A0A3F3QHC1_9EURO|nr:hypothetical protein BDQ94DRAFT_133741 [Aspergillus welwitschiae]RDH38349.1 hypothetical protein BDQ94DRAFT_133741 [Aspergillus welwitschiae]
MAKKVFIVITTTTHFPLLSFKRDTTRHDIFLSVFPMKYFAHFALIVILFRGALQTRPWSAESRFCLSQPRLTNPLILNRKLPPLRCPLLPIKHPWEGGSPSGCIARTGATLSQKGPI